MTPFRLFLYAVLGAILAYTAVTVARYGPNLLPAFFGEMMLFTWQGQFNLDFLTFLLLSGLWTAWRNGFTARGNALGAVAVFGGMVFLAAYLLILDRKHDGDLRRILLGVR